MRTDVKYEGRGQTGPCEWTVSFDHHLEDSAKRYWIRFTVDPGDDLDVNAANFWLL